MVHFPEDDVRKPAAAWFLADSRSQARNPMRIGELRDVVAMAEGLEAAFAASDLGDRITNDDLACRARLQALVAATADRAADDVLDVDAYTAPAVGPAVAADARPACANCGKTRRWDKADKPLSKCARCKSVAYCGAACQKAHWKAHKAACRAASAS
jgi:predicted Zn-ribbon and HTH transcriptional regulator